MSGVILGPSPPKITPSSSSVQRCSRVVQRRSSSVALSFSPFSATTHGFSSSHLKLHRNGSAQFSRNILRCNCSFRPGGPGENESKNVLDAFFLGKALGEALSERVESTIGEFLSTVGRVQAERQKQIQEFQEEVLERAKSSKERAAREAMEAQGLIPKSSAEAISTVVNGGATSSTAPNFGTPAVSPRPAGSSVQPSTSSDTDPLLGVPDEE